MGPCGPATSTRDGKSAEIIMVEGARTSLDKL